MNIFEKFVGRNGTSNIFDNTRNRMQTPKAKIERFPFPF
jgi:hypothetical protein